MSVVTTVKPIVTIVVTNPSTTTAPPTAKPGINCLGSIIKILYICVERKSLHYTQFAQCEHAVDTSLSATQLENVSLSTMHVTALVSVLMEVMKLQNLVVRPRVRRKPVFPPLILQQW